MSDFGFGYWVGLPLGLILGGFWGWLITGWCWHRSERKMQERHDEAIDRALRIYRAPSPRPPEPPRRRKIWFDKAGHPHFMDQDVFERALKAASEKLGEFTRKQTKE